MAPGWFYSYRSVFHGSRWFFMFFLWLQVWFSWCQVDLYRHEWSQVGLIPSWAKWDVKNTQKLLTLSVSWPHDPARPCRPKGGFGLVMMIVMIKMASFPTQRGIICRSSMMVMDVVMKKKYIIWGLFEIAPPLHNLGNVIEALKNLYSTVISN